MSFVSAVGSRPRITFTFVDVSGNVADPAGVTIVVRDPETETTYTYAGATVTKLSTGVYYVDVDTTGKPGTWYARAYSPVGSQQAAALDVVFYVQDTKA